MRTGTLLIGLIALATGCGDDGGSSGNAACTDDADCPTGQACHDGQCVVVQGSRCGDGHVDPGEDCDGGTGCSSDCHFLCSDDPATQCANTATLAACQTYGCTADHTCTVVADGSKDDTACDPSDATKVCSAGVCGPRCGNGVRNSGEDCDDGNQRNLDGCDSNCRVEQDARITSLQQQWTGDAFCPNNALGAAIVEDDAHTVIQGTWDAPVADGSLSLVFKFLNVTQPLGPTTNTSFSLGFMHVTPVAPKDDGSNPYDGTHDLDWWYVRDPASVDADEVPTVQLPGQLTAGHLTAGPGTIMLDLLFALQPAKVTLYHAKVDAQIDNSVAAPEVSTGAAPGHLASEHLDPAITTFTTSSGGAMCSDVSVKSFLDTPMPGILLLSCQDADGNPVFTDQNHLLDAFIAGCSIFGSPAGIAPTQPDGSLDGATYHFAFDSTTRQVTTCTRNGAPAELDDCAAQATYSSYFKFQSDRVIVHRE